MKETVVFICSSGAGACIYSINDDSCYSEQHIATNSFLENRHNWWHSDLLGFYCTLLMTFYIIYVRSTELSLWQWFLRGTVSLCAVTHAIRMIENNCVIKASKLSYPPGCKHWKVVGHFKEQTPHMYSVCLHLCVWGTCSKTLLLAGVSS